MADKPLQSIPPASGDDLAVCIEGLSKFYRIPYERKYTIFDHFFSIFRGNTYAYREFWALHDVSVKVKKGEVLGIIGSNGSGKSTLLKILAGVIYPDHGTYHIDGKIAPFLELGVGFQPDLTAKENVFLYGSIMGLSKKTIQEKYDEIIDFAEMREFENLRLKNFSSGMVVRLAFSTAIQLDPDIFLVDEVLSVGDESFQQKCMNKIEEIRRKGKTILFVSHDLSMVQALCERCMCLHHGEIASIGTTADVIADYHRLLSINNGTPSEDATGSKVPHRAPPPCEPVESELPATNPHSGDPTPAEPNEPECLREPAGANIPSSNVHIDEYTYGDHRSYWISTYPFGHIIPGIVNNPGHHKARGDVKIENDVFIGINAKLYSGVRISDGSAMRNASVITSEVGNYEIAMGNPARYDEYRFRDGEIRILKQIQWWDLSVDKDMSNMALHESDDIDRVLLRVASKDSTD
jgi:ABC-type polysaccharide/polyol phosphate transport system ATPase subunit